MVYPSFVYVLSLLIYHIGEFLVLKDPVCHSLVLSHTRLLSTSKEFCPSGDSDISRSIHSIPLLSTQRTIHIRNPFTLHSSPVGGILFLELGIRSLKEKPQPYKVTTSSHTLPPLPHQLQTSSQSPSKRQRHLTSTTTHPPSPKPSFQTTHLTHRTADIDPSPPK